MYSSRPYVSTWGGAAWSACQQDWWDRWPGSPWGRTTGWAEPGRAQARSQNCLFQSRHPHSYRWLNGCRCSCQTHRHEKTSCESAVTWRRCADEISNSILWSQQVDILLWVKRWDLSEQRVFTCELMSHSLEHPHPPRKKNIHLFLSAPNRLRRLHASTTLRRGKLQQFFWKHNLQRKECRTHKLSCFFYKQSFFCSVWFKVLSRYKGWGCFINPQKHPEQQD